MQLKQSADASEQYKGTIAGIRKIIHDEGVTGLYKGMVLWPDAGVGSGLIIVGVGPKLTQSVLNAAFLFMFKDLFFNSSKAVLRARGPGRK